MIYCVGMVSLWCHHYCSTEGSGKCSVVFSLILENWITSINLPGKGIWFKYFFKNLLNMVLELKLNITVKCFSSVGKPSIVCCRKNYCINWEVKLEDSLLFLEGFIPLHSSFVSGPDMLIFIYLFSVFNQVLGRGMEHFPPLFKRKIY